MKLYHNRKDVVSVINKKNGFTLVELLAVIVILAIILVIAVPQIMNTIEESRKGAIESTAKLIASQVERKALENQTLGIEEDIECKDVASLNDIDYESCSVTFDDEGNAKVTIVGKGKFEGMSVCNATKTSATVSESCDGTGNAGETGAEKLISLANNEETSTSNGIQVTSDENVRYVGSTPSNKVYYNCEEKDAAGVSYGKNNYDYANSCEIWRIIGVFDVEDGSGNTAKRIKIINTESTFKTSWKSGASGTNDGYGINQWGPSTLTDADGNEQPYAGAVLMQLLNGYYIGKGGTGGISCTTESLTNAKMKPLTSNAKGMIGNAVWNLGATEFAATLPLSTMYSGERGTQTGKICTSTGGTYDCCNDTVNRTTTWTGEIGLIYPSDYAYASTDYRCASDINESYCANNNWLHPSSGNYWTITPSASSSSSGDVWFISSSSRVNGGHASTVYGVRPALYLDSNVQIIGGDGLNTPYKLKA